MITRATLSTIEQGLPKYRSMLAGNAAFIPTSFESIATVLGTGSSGTITFNSIPADYQHLQLRMTFSAVSSADFIRIRFNNDSSSNYYTHSIQGSGSGVSVAAYAGSIYTASIIEVTVYPTGTTMGVAIVDILDYKSTNKNKTIRTLTGFDNNSSGAIEFNSGAWSATPAAITRIDLIGNGFNFTSNSHFALYGIKSA